MSPPPMRSSTEAVVLRGRDHVDYDDIVTRAVQPDIGLAITRGRHPKPYAYVDPNEDVVAAVVGARASLLLVADGHNGVEAAEVAVETVLDALGDDPTPDVSDGDLVDLFAAAGHAVVGHTHLLDHPNRESRTTLTVALLGPRRLRWASLGDSSLFVVGADGTRELTHGDHLFVGHRLSRPSLQARLQRGARSLDRGDRVVLATDGFTNFTTADPAVAVDVVLRGADGPVSAAAGLVGHAADGGAGDNVAVAVATTDQRG